jgi:RNA-binding protein Nova
MSDARAATNGTTDWQDAPPPAAASEATSAQKKAQLETGPCFLKFVLSNSAAGALIGKGGADMKTLEAEHGVAMKLSAGRSFFPGTQDRVLLVAGDTESLIRTLPNVLAKVGDAPNLQDKTGQPGPNLHLVKLVCNNRACGNIIGKAGAASKALAQATGVRMSIAEASQGVRERVISLVGTRDQVTDAIGMLLDKIQDEGAFSKEVNYNATAATPVAYAYAAPPQAFTPPGYAVPRYPFTSLSDYECTVEFMVPDSTAGSFIGRGGNVMKRIQKESSARIRLLEKGNGNGYRSVILAGSVPSVHMAHAELMRILQESGGSSVAPSQAPPPPASQ